MVAEHCIKFDAERPCPQCNTWKMHALTEYPDAEYGKCFTCHTRSTWIPDGAGHMRLADAKVPDRTRTLFNFKRAADRRYRKVGKNWEEEE